MNDIEAGVLATGMDAEKVRRLEEAEKVKIVMNEIRGILENLFEINEEMMGFNKQEILLNGGLISILKKAIEIRSQLQKVHKAKLVDKTKKSSKEGTPVDGTRLAVTNGLFTQLKEIMQEFQATRAKLVPKAGQEHQRGLETVVEIQDGHDTAKEIERSLLELHQVFLDMAVMVEVQSEQLDDTSSDTIKRESARKFPCCLFLAFVVVFYPVILGIKKAIRTGKW